MRVEGEDGRTVFGVVVDGRAHEDAQLLWTVSVLRQLPPEPMRPVPIGPVYLAGPDDVVTALRMDGYASGPDAAGLPVGLYGGGASSAPVYLDPDFLLGPEAAHVNLSGISGLATKTSAVEFLLSSIFQRFPAHKGRIAADRLIRRIRSDGAEAARTEVLPTRRVVRGSTAPPRTAPITASPR